MRIALLSTLDRNPTPGRVRPAFANFAGAMIVERQLDLAIKLGVERVACLVDAVESEVVQLQHRAERAGLKFRAIRRPDRLSGMVTADDELLVFAPGVLPDDDAVKSILERKTVLALPADLAVPLGYERLDLELAWAGVMLLPGVTVERLSDLPQDVDVPSALMRIALQSGTGVTRVERDFLTEGKWHLDPDRETLDLREKEWIAAQRRQIAFRAPGLAVAERAGARLARDLLGKAGESLPAILAGLSAIGALGAGVFGYTTFGLGLTTLTALFAHMAGVVERVSRLGRPNAKENPLLRVLDYAIDPIFVVLLLIAAPAELGFLGPFVPLVLFGLLHLGARHASKPWRATYMDRILLGFLLTPAAFFGYSLEMAAAIALLVLATRFFERFRDG
ncbi:hypothetical protein K3152_04175 [Qipengyuania sp. 1NDH17]|uniref:Uncharacterized protein n=1 Tax=Qipengyuania polymorpha TaxID=2867234 RepID=A0ABS7IZD5_9SPHN|nr:hypothetical protein [Qipengyuania polymorpha]MBX7457435.1 hypothetical protein [Qipengyuania polymorpha]